MAVSGLDILMVTHDQPDYVKLSLPRLLETCDEDMRVWVWHNGTHEETLELSRALADDPRVAAWHHSPENVPLREPTNWLFSNAKGDYLSKVDDDCLVSHGWAQTFIAAHQDFEGFGAIGSWRFLDEDFRPELSLPKVYTYAGGHKLLKNMWVQGSGFVLKKACVERHGLLRKGQTFPKYITQLSLKGWANGWYYPFVPEEDMDDPRSVHSRFRTDEDLQERLPLMASYNGISTLAEWQDQILRTAYSCQAATLDPRYYRGWRLKRHNLGLRAKSLLGDTRKW